MKFEEIPPQRPDAPQSPTSQRRILAIAFMTVCLDLLGFGIIIPIQPFYAEGFGASPTMVTLLGASYSLMQFIFAPFWGRLSDRVGRRPVVLVSVAIGAVGYLGFGLAGSLGALFVARMLSGFGNANIATIQAIIADTTSGADRAKGMGLIGAAFGLGFIFGPVLGGALGQFGLAYPAYGAAVLGVINWIFAYFMLPETRAPSTTTTTASTSHAEAHARARLSPLATLRRLGHYPNVLRIAAISLIMTTGFALMEQAIGLFIERVWVPGALTATDEVARQLLLREAASLTATLLVVIGLTAAIVQGGLIGRLSRSFGERSLILVGLIGLGVSQLLFIVVGHVGLFWLMMPVGVLLAASSGITTPTLNSLLSRSVGPDEQGAAAGLGQSASALGRVFGPAASGALFEISRDIPFALGATLLFIAFAAALGLQRRATTQHA